MYRNLATCMAAILLATATVPLAPAVAHHGYAHKFDVTSPIFVSGVVKARSGTAPHGSVTIEADRSVGIAAVAWPRGVGDLRRAKGLSTRYNGDVRVTVNPLKNGFVGRSAELAPGKRIAIVALRECRTGELRAQAIWYGEGLRNVDVSRYQRNVEGCA